MKIAIIADSHDNWPNIEKAIAYLKQQEISTMIHCGDVCAPRVMAEMAQLFGDKMHLVYGNVDGDTPKMEELAKDLPNLEIHGQVGALKIDGKKIAFVHYPWLADKLAKSDQYDAVFYGHDHTPWEKQVGRTFVRNPGTLAGLFAKATFAVYDTATNQAQLLLLEKLQ